MKYCPNCGKIIIEGYNFCSECGYAINETSNIMNNSSDFTQQNYYQTPVIKSVSTERATEYASKLSTESIVWTVIGILQILIGGIFGTGNSVNDILVLIIGIINIVAAIKIGKTSKRISETKTGMVKYIKSQSLIEVIIISIWNVFAGGLIGIVIVVYEIVLYSYGKKHLDEFIKIEEYIQKRDERNFC